MFKHAIARDADAERHGDDREPVTQTPGEPPIKLAAGQKRFGAVFEHHSGRDPQRSQGAAIQAVLRPRAVRAPTITKTSNQLRIPGSGTGVSVSIENTTPENWLLEVVLTSP